MEREDFERLITAVKVLPLRPQDKIVINIQQWLSSQQREMVTFAMTERFGRPVIILEGGADIEVIRPET